MFIQQNKPFLNGSFEGYNMSMNRSEKFEMRDDGKAGESEMKVNASLTPTERTDDESM